VPYRWGTTSFDRSLNTSHSPDRHDRDYSHPRSVNL